MRSSSQFLLIAMAGMLLASGLYIATHRKQNVSLGTPAQLKTFAAWTKTHGKTYSSPSEFLHRLSIFLKNAKTIEEHNKSNAQWTMGLNFFSDMSVEEFKAKFTGYKGNDEVHEVATELLERDYAPSNDVDWVSAGAVTPIKNQGQCGSCWAFSATGAMEGLDFITNKKLDSFSEQQLVDCSGSYGNEGCNGGWQSAAFKYVTKNGIESESMYPYTAHDGKCHSKAGIFHIKGFKNVPNKSSAALAHACDTQPIAVTIDAEKIMHYKQGIFNNADCGKQLDHAVLLVGYTSDYWHVKNSWGTSWGEEGYIRFSRSAVPDTKGGICGILLGSLFPTE